jgi:type II secretory pathway predicted ATPase ExeA
MFLEHFHLKEQPFGVTPDPRFLCLGPSHREAIASLLYGITTGRGFMALIAEPGMGKTTLLFELLKSLGNSATTVFLFQTQCSPEDFLRNILADLGINHRGANLAEMQARLNEAVLVESEAGRRLVVAIDEAQNLEKPVLELLRMLSNFETPREKLMQIILTGQPQLATKLSSPDLIQLRQRISIFGRLKNLSADEVDEYIDHRLRVAGYESKTPLFTARARAMIAIYSRGIPRNINNICFNALSLACALKKKTINSSIIEEVLTDLDLGTLEAQASTAAATSQERTPKVIAAGQRTRASRFAWAPRLGVAAAILILALPILYGSQNGWKLPASWSSALMESAKRASLLVPWTATKSRGFYSPTPAENVVTDDVLPELPLTIPADFVNFMLIAPPKGVRRPAIYPANNSMTLAGTRLNAAAQHVPLMPVPFVAAPKINSSILNAAEKTANHGAAPIPVSIQVAPNDTLWTICMRNLRKCDRDVIQQIVAINPCITDPSSLRPGLWLVMPKGAKAPEYARGSAVEKEVASQ